MRGPSVPSSSGRAQACGSFLYDHLPPERQSVDGRAVYSVLMRGFQPFVFVGGGGGVRAQDLVQVILLRRLDGVPWVRHG
eukprot:CAMPEP_0182562622 /NCGR_PEP_ID=MMETSP1324-20130603/4935_1 /TAXON_ID=236786 /ORGANISM="Florenciella sp., Strain RCC1587" /LENGTH=79 /DNA_ID=CAMNT_0024775617 /DNA_START=279 /DNA_END=514 /DNA_ORIENTATION=+